MLVLDTDHLSEYQKGISPSASRLKQRLDEAGEPFVVRIISVEEVMRGWMASIRRTSNPRSQIRPYARLGQLFRFFATWSVFDWDDAAVDEFESLKNAIVRVGTMDLKIASISLAHGATLLTRNTNDFTQIPGLYVEDWLPS